MADRPQNVFRAVIDGKEYSCKKLPYRQARELQFELASVLGPLLAMSQQHGDMNIVEAMPMALGQIGTKGSDLIIRLCETCFVDGRRVSADSFNADKTTDLEVAKLALETHFGNFIKELPDALGRLTGTAEAPATTS